jgi:hypothetical protein
MVAAMECDYERLAELRNARDSWEGDEQSTWATDNPDDAEELADLEEAAGDCEDADQARERIEEDPLSVEVRSDWHTPGDRDGMTPAEYCILLCTGGPACRIVGDLDQYGQPTSARIEHKDWGTSWAEYHSSEEADRASLLAYARCFYFGE